MKFDSLPDEITTFSTQEGEPVDAERLLENPKEAFVEKELTPDQQKSAALNHEAIISNPDLFLGSGNDAVVFEIPMNEGAPLCAKHIWENVSVELRGKQYASLSPRLRELRRIQDYFDKVKEKRRELVKKGVEFVPSNHPMSEAGIQVAARKILEEAGFARAVPEVKSFLRIESKGDGAADGMPYAYDEIADTIVMEMVNGKSIQDLVLGYEEHIDLIEKMDVASFKSKLKAMLSALHERELTHQDVTNRNIMIDFDTLEPVIIDFGKASYRTGNFSKDDELGHADAVCRTLASLKKDPEKMREELKKMLDIAF